MEGDGLAAQAVALLGPYLAAVGGGTAARVGQALGDGLLDTSSRLFARVRRAFATDPQAADDLVGLQRDPCSRGRQTVVQELLSEFIENDQQFAQELKDLVGAAMQAGGDTITQVASISSSTVGDVTQIGKIEGRD